MIDFSAVTYGYTRKQVVLKDVSFHLDPGSFTALMGPSGAGKSTILWQIMGELQPNEGEVHCLGQQPGALKKRKLMKYRRKIGYVPQELLLLEHHNVYSNVNSILCGMGLTAREAATRTRNVLELVKLTDKKKELPSELSGGERQRLAIARSLGMMPAVLLADEPTGNLDPALSEEIMGLFKQINNMGITVVIATHEQDLMRKLEADVLYVEPGGEVRHTAFDGSPVVRKPRPATAPVRKRRVMAEGKRLETKAVTEETEHPTVSGNESAPEGEEAAEK